MPALFLVGSAISAVRSGRRRLLYGRVVEAESPSALNQMTWRDFERLVGAYFSHLNFKIVELGGTGADGGVDLIARKGSDEYLIQCKQWKSLRVGVVPVRELYGVVAARRAAGGFVVTSGSFTDEARNFANGASIELIDGKRLASAISRKSQPRDTILANPDAGDLSKRRARVCPSCGAEMVLRTARAGANPGSRFWGCSRYPKCRATRPVV